MKILTETFGDALVAHTPDELSDDTMPAVHEALQRLIEGGQTNIVLQMDHSESFDSAGLTGLLDLQDELREQGGCLKISGLSAGGRKIFEVTRLDQQFDVFESVIDAVGSFQ